MGAAGWLCVEQEKRRAASLARWPSHISFDVNLRARRGPCRLQPPGPARISKKKRGLFQTKPRLAAPAGLPPCHSERGPCAAHHLTSGSRRQSPGSCAPAVPLLPFWSPRAAFYHRNNGGWRVLTRASLDCFVSVEARNYPLPPCSLAPRVDFSRVFPVCRSSGRALKPLSLFPNRHGSSSVD